MRLLLVIDSLTAGGAQRQLVNLAIELAGRGHFVRVFTYHEIDFFGPQLRAAGIEVLRRQKRWRYETRVVRVLSQEMDEGDYDGVVSFLSVPNVYAILAGRMSRRRPPVVISHRASAVGRSLRLRERMALRTYRWADAVTVNSHHMRDFLAGNHPHLCDRIVTIWNGVDTEHFAPQRRPQPSQHLRLLAIGNLAPGKDWLTLAKAAAVLRDRHGISAHVDHAGRDETLNRDAQAYAAQIEQFLDEAGLRQQWSWLGRRDDVPELLHQHDALVHPSAEEGLPNVVCEALACGCPPVVSNALDHPRLVQHGERGFLFTPHDARDLARQLAELQAVSHGARSKMANAARAFACKHLSQQRMADEYETLLSKLARQRNPRPSVTPR